MALARSQVRRPVAWAALVALPWLMWFALSGGIMLVFAALTLGAAQYANWRRGGPMEQWYRRQARASE